MRAVDYLGYTVYEDGTIIGKRGLPLKPQVNKQGYLFVVLYITNELSETGRRHWKTQGVHRLVAKCFIENPDNLPEVDHLDNDKHNNHYTNLEWTTRGENIRRTYERKGRSATGVNNARCITSEETVHSVCRLIVKGLENKAIREIVGCRPALIQKIRSKRNWTCISQHYNF